MKKLITITICCFAVLSVKAQNDTIRLQDNRLNTGVLKPGLNQYLVYFQAPQAKKSLNFWFWLRDIRLETRNGEKVFTISQHWYMSDTASYHTSYSVNKASDFSPVYHSESNGKKIKAYNWNSAKITGADSVTQNLAKAFSLDFKLPNFNWNLDIETFEMLPLAQGKNFLINFYDAGLDPPAYVSYKVTGSEEIATLDNQKVDCWILFSEGDQGKQHFTQTFWISKKNHEFLKEQDTFNGMYRYKIKMPGTAPDLLKRFGKA